ncbi:uncharacterized protein LOC130738148 [Lotus japonicus]|uniref:uncharacterized protein LOC130738148 n=1 Tax=Lotus japonicus TaxID=34305 RepID=UPI0025825CA6|nr:uncharacterized protein LOC130738148 [Lotus japonicus]
MSTYSSSCLPLYYSFLLLIFLHLLKSLLLIYLSCSLQSACDSILQEERECLVQRNLLWKLLSLASADRNRYKNDFDEVSFITSLLGLAERIIVLVGMQGKCWEAKIKVCV